MNFTAILKDCEILTKKEVPFTDAKSGNELLYYVVTFEQGDFINGNITCAKDIYPKIVKGQKMDLILSATEVPKNGYTNTKFRISGIVGVPAVKTDK